MGKRKAGWNNATCCSPFLGLPEKPRGRGYHPGRRSSDFGLIHKVPKASLYGALAAPSISMRHGPLEIVLKNRFFTEKNVTHRHVFAGMALQAACIRSGRRLDRSSPYAPRPAGPPRGTGCRRKTGRYARPFRCRCSGPPHGASHTGRRQWNGRRWI